MVTLGGLSLQKVSTEFLNDEIVYIASKVSGYLRSTVMDRRHGDGIIDQSEVAVEGDR